MRKNMGPADRILRVAAALILATLFSTQVITGMLGNLLMILAGIFVLTSIIGFCPIYVIFGYNSCPVRH